MKQHQIDLLPDSIRQRLQAGVRTSQTVAAYGSVIALLLIVITYGRYTVNRAEREVEQTRQQANFVLELDARSKELRTSFDEANAYMEMYHKVAPPLNVSAIAATIINELPESVALDRIDISAGSRQPLRTARSRGREEKVEAAPRVLTCEIAGFAHSDEQVAQIVDRLSAQPPFEKVSLDFSRTRLVRDHSAREFRLSCRIDLDALYQVVSRESQNDGSIPSAVAEVGAE